MSPEQATRRLADVDARSDIYSLGAVAYFLLTGQPAVRAATTPMDVMIAHARDEVVPPSGCQPDVPADLERVVLRCLAKNPDDRFPDADSLRTSPGRLRRRRPLDANRRRPLVARARPAGDARGERGGDRLNGDFNGAGSTRPGR